MEGKVICVRLALFAEMMKGKEWTAASLKEVGGTKGVGETFLEETFSSSSASPNHRYRQKAARAILKDRIPDSGTDIKGYMRSHAELLEASSYGNRPKDSDDLTRILDGEIRLVTPTDPEGVVCQRPRCGRLRGRCGSGKWDVTLPKLPVGEAVSTEEQKRRWYVNSQGQAMIVSHSPAEDGESRINHSMAISSHEVTVAEFRRFRQQHAVDRNVAPSDDCPVHSVSWYDVAEYCNWLSKQDGIPEDQWIYEPNPDGKYADGMTIKENHQELLGYRLPNETEWEQACRAGTRGWYGFGEPVPLLNRYARFVVNSSGRSHSVESMLPNADGLFDMHGSLWEWVQNSSSHSMSPVRNGVSRVLRGGSFSSHTSNVRSANGNKGDPSSGGSLIGFRPSRTYNLSP